MSAVSPSSASATPSSASANGSFARQRVGGQQLSRGGSSSGFSERRRSSILVGQRSVDLLMEQGSGSAGPRFVLFVIRMFRRWGYFVADHDWQAMLICGLTSLLGLYFVLITPQQNDITGYAPYNARAREEYSRYQEFFSRDGPGISAYIFVLAKDGGSMLREEYLNETIGILNIASEEVRIPDPRNPHNGTGRSFVQFCRSFCKFNEPLRAFYNGLRVQNEQARQGQKLNGRINLDYPAAHIFGRSITLQQTFFGLDFYNDTSSNFDQQLEFNLTAALLSAQAEESPLEEADGANGTDLATELGAVHPRHVTNMRGVKMVVLQFNAEHEPGWTSELVKAYELAMVDRFQRQYHSDRLQLYVLSKSYIEAEMVRAGLSVVPYMSVGLFVMFGCSLFSVLTRVLYMHQHWLSKIPLAIAACILPFMSSATALGLMFACGVRFASILCLIPILVLSIGVDSSYLMIHEWQRVIKHCGHHPNRKNCHVGYRISQVLSEVGPAILISMLTNVFADGTGAYTSSPELGGLCLGNLVSMLVAFLYQMTFYAGLMSLVGRYEIARELRERRELQESIRKAIDAAGKGGDAGAMELGANGKPPLARQQSKFHEHTKHYISETMLAYVNFVANKFVAFLIVCLYFVYLAMSIWGITRMEINLSVQKLFTRDSPLIELDKLRVQYQVPYFMQATVLVSHPGNLSDPARLARMNAFVSEMEAINGSWGPVGTQYFVRDFATFETSFEGEVEPELAELEAGGEEDGSELAGAAAEAAALAPVKDTPNGPFHEEDLAAFVRWPEYTHWGAFIKLDNKTGRLRRFFFTSGYHGQQLTVWTERGRLLNQWRQVVDNYTKTDNFNASVFHEDAVFLDLIDNMPWDTLQSVVGTLVCDVCMAVVCFCFLNSMFTVVMASGCVLSICCGILGILSWWNIDLDPITMAAMIISIGFSVDIPAHVSYHYYQATARELDATPQMKLVNCLSSVAFPALQAALSTTLCVSSLLLARLYMADVFVKTMVLCVVLCNLHGLVFLPAVLILFDTVTQPFRKHFGGNGKRTQNGNAQRPTTIPEGSKENSVNGHEKNGTAQHPRNGRAPAQKSQVTDRPKLERYPSLDEMDNMDNAVPMTAPLEVTTIAVAGEEERRRVAEE